MTLNTVFMIVSISLSIMIFGVNMLIILLMVRNISLLKNISNQILLSLVCADLLTGLSMVLHIIATVVEKFALPQYSNEFLYRILVDIITLWLHLVTMGNLCFIVFERYVVLCHTYSRHRYINRKNVYIILSLIWIISFAFPCIQLMWLKKVIRGNMTMDEWNFVDKLDSIFSSVSIVLFVLVPIAILFLALFRMYRIIQSFSETERTQNLRALKLFSAMYITFVIFCLPYFLIRLLIDVESLNILHVSKFSMQCVYIMKYLPPFLNPFIYVFTKPDFRKLISAKWKKCKVFCTYNNLKSYFKLVRQTKNGQPAPVVLWHCVTLEHLHIESIRDYSETTV